MFGRFVKWNKNQMKLDKNDKVSHLMAHKLR